MTNPYSMGDRILVPAGLLSDRDDQPYACVTRTVRKAGVDTVTVDDFSNANAQNQKTKRLNIERVHSDSLGVLVLRVGDLSSEETLLDPLAGSVNQFLRLLLPDDRICSISLRTWAELAAYWTKHNTQFTHVVLVSHAGSDGISFLDRPNMSGEDFGGDLQKIAPDTPPKVFLSLACQTGRASFLKKLSENKISLACIAPYHKVHGAAASQFCQAFMVFRLLEGKGIDIAHELAAKSGPTNVSWRRWTKGSLVTVKHPVKELTSPKNHE